VHHLVGQPHELDLQHHLHKHHLGHRLRHHNHPLDLEHIHQQQVHLLGLPPLLEGHLPGHNHLRQVHHLQLILQQPRSPLLQDLLLQLILQQTRNPLLQDHLPPLLLQQPHSLLPQDLLP